MPGMFGSWREAGRAALALLGLYVAAALLVGVVVAWWR